MTRYLRFTATHIGIPRALATVKRASRRPRWLAVSVALSFLAGWQGFPVVGAVALTLTVWMAVFWLAVALWTVDEFFDDLYQFLLDQIDGDLQERATLRQREHDELS